MHITLHWLEASECIFQTIHPRHGIGRGIGIPIHTVLLNFSTCICINVLLCVKLIPLINCSGSMHAMIGQCSWLYHVVLTAKFQNSLF